MGVIPSQNITPTPQKVDKITQGVTQQEIDNLPLSLRFQLDMETRRRKILKMPLELRERQEYQVRRFRGY